MFPCSRHTAKVCALIFGLFQIMRIHSYGGRLISIVGSRFKEVLRAFLWILMRYYIVGTIVDSNKVLRGHGSE